MLVSDISVIVRIRTDRYIYMNKEELIKGLNDRQREAVECTEGPLLILAGAGSGKTRILTHRIGYLIADGVAPWHILAITFTNKAAREMRERVDKLLESAAAQDVFVSTFHSMCVRLLRRDIEKLGYSRDFTIYDADDQKTLVRKCIKDLRLDSKMYRERAVLSIISSQKNVMVGAAEYADSASDYYEKNVAKVYAEYEKQLRANNALDFDDLLVKTVDLFRRFPEVLEHWQERFRYILVDEYQDTNNVQFEIVRMLSARYGNLCVVGDDDQSIYKFRGANIENILSFEKTFPKAKVIKLEQNYRSTKAILNAANEVIKNNKGRKDKRLWTENEAGVLPDYNEYDTAAGEALAIVKQAEEAVKDGVSLKDQAILYRTNAQSRLLEEKCVQRGLPYIIVGGVNFYQRKEIKDILSYLRVIANGVDDLACARIINVPKRGIGQTSVDRVSAWAVQHGISFYDALKRCREIESLGNAAAKKIEGFVAMTEEFREDFRENGSIRSLIEAVRDDTGYADELKNDDPISAETRLENIEELINKAVSFEDEYGANASAPALKSSVEAAGSVPFSIESLASGEADGDGDEAAASSAGGTQVWNEGFEMPEGLTDTDPLNLLALFLEDISLVADIDRTDPDNEAITMMTLHAAKGLEFDTVYLCGMEDGLFPSSAAINSDDPEGELEEERRLCYVGFTRARKILHLSSAGERMVNGDMRYMKPSRFIDEIPDDAATKHFRREHYRSGESREPFSDFGGYEGSMEYGYSHGDGYGEASAYGRGGSSYGKNSSYGSCGGENSYGSYGGRDSGSSYGGSYGGETAGRYGSGGFTDRYSQNNGVGDIYSKFGKELYRNDPYSKHNDSYGQGNAGSSYNAFDNSRVGRFGSLDDTPAGRTKKQRGASGAAGLSGIAGLSKGFGDGNVKKKPDYEVGDRVTHIKFGLGTVAELTDEPKDYKVSVDFDEAGRKVMYAGFAKLKKV